MIPPHGVCSKPAMRALADCGFFSACFWIDPAHVADPVVAGLQPADDTAEGLPVIARQPFTESLESLALDAYLRRPLVLYGHHRDLAGDPDRLTELAGTLAQLGDVRWCGLGEVAVTNVSRRRAGGVLHLWLHARRVRIRIPDGVEELVVRDADPSELDVVVVSNCNGRELGRADPGLPLEVGNESEVEVRLERRKPNAATTPTGLRPWPVMRRTLVEGRDRLIPLLP
jgi:hypothetical protein